MRQKATYQLTGRQLVLLAVISAFIAVAAVAAMSGFGIGWNYFMSGESAEKTFAETRPAITDPATVTDEENNIEIYKKMSPGVAFITTSARFENWFGEEFERESGIGSGSVIDNQGHILTNYHVIEGASKLTVSFGGDKIYPATLVGGDPDTDLAVIKIVPPAEGLTVIPLGDSGSLDVGQKVLAIGNPFGLDRTLTTGVISGLQRPIRARNGRPIDAAIQTDASINSGNSGGPLLDKFGRMIGINSQILSPSGASAGVGFAVPVNTAKRVVPQLLQFGEVRRPKLGASLYGVEELRDRGIDLPIREGLLVRSVVPGGSIDRAGLRGLSSDGQSTLLGDIITSIDGQKVNNIDDLYRFLDKKKIGETVSVQVYRRGDTITVPVKLLQMPETRSGNRRF
ncbi:MAG: trypsin-like peptidase domain-containing protein [Acidobacteriota bacterium]|nr:MAG: trypsin-like peptidase domain-containing protein [Acidobacteriota bacterium]